MAANALWTPDGPVAVNRNQVSMPAPDMRKLAQFHEVAAKYGFVVVCPKCDKSLMGKNNDSQGGVYVVACACTEYICDTNR